MRYKVIPFLLAIILSLPVLAQKENKDRKSEKRQRINALIKQEEEGVIAYNKHNVFGIKLINDGYGFFYEHARAQSIKKALLFQIDFSERKHVKEKKQAFANAPSSPFIYGKINFFYPLKLGVQQQFLFGNKSNKNGVTVTGNFGGGISLGLLRPYYVNVNDTSNNRKGIKYESADSSLFVNNDSLEIGSAGFAGFTKGWNQIKVKPGLYAKAGLRFDYGRFNEMVNALEVGVTAEYYFSKIPQLVYTKQSQLFLNVYVALVFGRRK